METGLAGKVAIVTGAGRPRGIGAAIARALAREGARVVVSDIGRVLDDFPDYQVAARDEIEQVREELEKLGAEAAVVHTDVADEGEVGALVARTVERFGRLDVMVNNAGLGLELVPVTEISVAAFRRNLEVMALGRPVKLMALVRKAAPTRIRPIIAVVCNAPETLSLKLSHVRELFAADTTNAPNTPSAAASVAVAIPA